MRALLIIAIIFFIAYQLYRYDGSGSGASQNGIALNQLVDNIMSKYDSNTDGVLDVAMESFLRTPSTEIVKVESRGLLFTDADGFGNKDGTVSHQELMAYLKEYDTDGDGEITSFKSFYIFGKSEWAVLNDKYEERYKYDEK